MESLCRSKVDEFIRAIGAGTIVKTLHLFRTEQVYCLRPALDFHLVFSIDLKAP